ncbi:MAG: response regulator [Leptospiraceae bacterium]|nr:response regulator [Leptospiraceae bacterium]
MKILIHIHSNAFRKYLVSALSNIEHESDIVHSPSEILEMLKTNLYDAVAFNVEMEGVNGIDLAEEIRKLNSKIPILLFSSRKETVEKLQSRNISQVEVLPNDIKVEQLKLILSKYDNSESSPKKILLVEDDKVNQILFKKLIKKTAFTLETADNGKRALELLSQENFKLVFMDMEMPVLNGYETTKVIRESSSSVLNHEVPIIALTGNNNEKDKEKCKEAGMNDFLTKPIQIEEINRIIAFYSK